MTGPPSGTSGGVELTDELIERLAAEAGQGYPPERLRPRQRSRPGRMGQPDPEEAERP